MNFTSSFRIGFKYNSFVGNKSASDVSFDIDPDAQTKIPGQEDTSLVGELFPGAAISNDSKKRPDKKNDEEPGYDDSLPHDWFKPEPGDYIPPVFKGMDESQLFPNAYVQPESTITIEEFRELSGKGQPIPKRDSFEESRILNEERAARRFYPVQYNSRKDYLKSKAKYLPQSSSFSLRLAEIENQAAPRSPDETVKAYIGLLENNVYPVFKSEMPAMMFSFTDTFDTRAGGSHAHFMNEFLVPALKSYEEATKTFDQASKEEAMKSLSDFATSHFHTDHGVFNTLRYEFAASVVNVGGVSGLPYVKELFEDLSEKIRDSSERSTAIIKQ